MQTSSNHTTDGTNARLDNPSVRQPLHWAQHDANLGTIRNSTPDGLHTVHSHVPNLYNSWWQSQLHNAIFRHNRITNLGSTVHDRTSGIFNAVENAGEQPFGLLFSLLLRHRSFAIYVCSVSVARMKCARCRTVSACCGPASHSPSSSRAETRR